MNGSGSAILARICRGRFKSSTSGRSKDRPVVCGDGENNKSLAELKNGVSKMLRSN